MQSQSCREIQAVTYMTYLNCTVISFCVLLHGKGLLPTTSCDGGAGVEEHCKEYQYVEQRQGWEAEQRRLKKELEKHTKHATKVRPAFKLCSSPLAVACCLLCPLRLWLPFRSITNLLYCEKHSSSCV